jgi:hypothetical protein
VLLDATRRNAGSGTFTISINEVAKTADPFDNRDQEQGSRSVITDTAANVGAKPNSRKPRILTVIGISPGPCEENRQIDVGERMDEREHSAGHDAALDEREYDMAQRAPARGAETRRGELDVRRQGVKTDATVRTANGMQMTTCPTSSAVKPMYSRHPMY